MRRTPRGFAIYGEFQDEYGAEVRVQESRRVGPRKVWVFVKGGSAQGEGGPNNGWIHLNRTKAKQLIGALNRYLEHYP